MNFKFDRKLGFFSRGKSDVGIWNEQRGWKGLNTVSTVLNPGSVVLDLGAHIGLFTKYFSTHNPGLRYLCVEPDPNNLELLEKNLAVFNVNRRIYKAAVVQREGGKVSLYLGKTYPACNSLESYRGRTEIKVSTVAFKRLLSFNPVIIKCDIEGGEYLLNWSTLPTSVRGIGFEFHYNRPEWESQMVAIDKCLLKQGFVHYKAPKVNRFSKVSFGVYVRQ